MSLQADFIKINKFLGIEIKNELIRAVILPELGGKIWELNDLMRSRQWIWHRQDIPLSLPQPEAIYDDVWAGGWEELFPNDAPGKFEGRMLPDHGEWWTLNWNYDIQKNAERVSILLRANTNIIKTECVKEVIINKDSSELEVKYEIISKENKAFHFLFKQHLAVNITPECKLWMPDAMVKSVDPSFSSLIPDGKKYNWPYVKYNKNKIDLSEIPLAEKKHKEFIYLWNLSGNWCGIKDMKHNATIRMINETPKMPFVWLFLTYGGWRNLYTAVLEPCTNMPKDLSEATRLNQSAKLDFGKEFKTKIKIKLEGLD